MIDLSDVSVMAKVGVTVVSLVSPNVWCQHGRQRIINSRWNPGIQRTYRSPEAAGEQLVGSGYRSTLMKCTGS